MKRFNMEVKSPVTLDHIARHVGVSRTLVSLALRNSPRVAASSRQAIQKAADELGYRPNLLARHLASPSTQTVGVILTELHNPIFADVYHEISNTAATLGYRTLLAEGSVDARREEESVESLIDFRVDALVLLGTSLPPAATRALAARIPVVVVGRRPTGVDAVFIDDRGGARLAVEHLLGLGHGRIAHIDGGHGPGASLRRATYVELMRSHQLASQVRTARGDYTEPGGEVAAEKLLRGRSRPTAIFAANDLTAIGAMAVARRLGIAVPDELSIVGFDDTWVASCGVVSLTTIEQPRQAMGAAAIELLVRRLKEPDAPTRHRVIESRLVERETSAPPRQRRTPSLHRK